MAANQPPDPVTRADIDGLRHDTQGLKESVDTFATKAELKDAQRLSRRANINSGIGLAALAFVAVLAYAGWNSNSNTLDRNAAATADRRLADCHSMDDVGAAIKAGVSVLPADPQVAEFITEYNAAVDKAIVQAKARKGYSADCKVISAPPSNGG